MKKSVMFYCLGCVAAGAVLVSGCRRQPEEVPEIIPDRVVEAPRVIAIEEPVLPILPELDLDPEVERRRMTGVLPGDELLPEPPPRPEPRGPEVIEPFDQEAHQEALITLAPAHHARMAEARLAMEAAEAREQELLQNPAWAEIADEISRLRTSLAEAASGDDAEAFAQQLASKEAELAALLEADAQWRELHAEAQAAEQRRENVRQEIVTRIQARMRHDFAVKRAERDLEPSAETDENVGE